MTTTRTLLAAAMCVTTIHCTPAPSTTERRAPPQCPELGCGLNGAWLGADLPFRELDLAGQPNEAGLKIESFANRDGDPLAIDVVGDQLLGRIGGGVKSGTALEGATLTLVTAKAPVSRYFLRIERVSSTAFWTETCASTKCDTVPLYTITFTKQGGPTKPTSICEPLDPDIDGDPSIDGTAIIFRGDRYTDEYDVDEPPNTSWFNIACAGTATSKLHLLRHTRASRGPDRITSVAQRQAVLRMLTADYCGVGHPFTTDGHPLRYTFRQRWEPLRPRFDESGRTLSSIDALWDADGAICVGTPRLADQQAEDELLREIRAVCGRPVVRCDHPLPDGGADVDAILTRTGAYAISANPR
jgi:hypothetical protein